MARKILRTPRARLDLIEIWLYIAADNSPAADRFLGRIEEALRLLRDNPQAGRAQPELAADLRSFPVGNYVMFYRPHSDGVELVHALSGYQDIGAEEWH